jgi:hypothetical protein
LLSGLPVHRTARRPRHLCTGSVPLFPVHPRLAQFCCPPPVLAFPVLSGAA